MLTGGISERNGFKYQQTTAVQIFTDRSLSAGRYAVL
jgi:hypothetical protein